MCGICGVAFNDSKKTPDLSLLRRMNAVLKHRGPDEENVFLQPGIGLAHQRLSIIDLSTGSQPMSDASGRYTISFNGEIYNFQELRQELIEKGCTFKTTSDTEVILNMYAEKGSSCVLDFRGMFAFAIWDNQEKNLFIARDRIGKKPLYYSQWRNQLIFGSEIKSILQYPDFPRDVNFEALHNYLCYSYIPYPQTAFNQIFELPPAHWLLWNSGKVQLEKYWQVQFQPKNQMNLETASSKLWELFRDSTRLRMISDVPLGVFLSGGIDSSTVVAAMSEVSTHPIRTFAIGFEETSHNELPFASQVSKLFSTQHEEFVVRPNAVEMIPQLVWHYDQPFADSSALPSFYVAKMASQKVKVVLNGDGGDESFLGYTRYRMIKMWEFLLALPAPMKKTLSSLFRSSKVGGNPYHLLSRTHRLLVGLKSANLEEIYERYMIQFPSSDRRKLMSASFFERVSGHSPESLIRRHYQNHSLDSEYDRIAALELASYLPSDLLVKMDRATMAYGLEARSPFLDHRIIEFAAKLPVKYKMKGFTLKYLIKYMMRKKLPSSILNRPKAGFGVPVSLWFRTTLKKYAKEILLDHQTLKRSYFNIEEVERYLNENEAGNAGHGHRIWTLLMFELWHRRFIDKVPSL